MLSAGTKRLRDIPAHRDRYAITFGEVAILHVGGAEIGSGRRDKGFSVQELADIHIAVVRAGGKSKLVEISAPLPPHLQEGNEAAVLIIRNGADYIARLSSSYNDTPGIKACGETRSIADSIEKELRDSVIWDKKFFDTRTKKTKNKRARYNTTFGDNAVQHSNDYMQPTVNCMSELKVLNAFREGLRSDQALGQKASGLYAEGNHYYEEKSGIGFHGDSERKIVICLSIGGESTLRYQWRFPGSSEHTLPPVDVRVKHGDVYVMSEKATGFDWRMRSKVRVVHAAGYHKYIGKEPVEAEAVSSKSSGGGTYGNATKNRQTDLKRHCSKISTCFPSLSRKFPHLTDAERNALLLGEDPAPRKDTALHLLHNLRRASKLNRIDDSTDVATIFNDNRPSSELLIEFPEHG